MLYSHPKSLGKLNRFLRNFLEICKSFQSDIFLSDLLTPKKDKCSSGEYFNYSTLLLHISHHLRFLWRGAWQPELIVHWRGFHLLSVKSNIVCLQQSNNFPPWWRRLSSSFAMLSLRSTDVHEGIITDLYVSRGNISGLWKAFYGVKTFSNFRFCLFTMQLWKVHFVCYLLS